MRLKLAEEAKKPGDSILVQTLIFMADEAGLRIAEELIRRAQLGVRVEVVIDALSPFLDIRDLTVNANTQKMYRRLMAAGIPVYGFRCKNHHLIDQMKLGYRTHTGIVNERPHEKLWIVNNKKGILGGMNIGNDYFRVNRPGYSFWRDQDVLIEGKDIIQDMVNIFDGNLASYRANYRDPRSDTCFNPHDPLEDAVAYEEFYQKAFQHYRVKRRRASKRSIQAFAQASIRKIERELVNLSFLRPVSEALHAVRVVHNRPKLKELFIEEAYLDLIDRAREEILIENAYFIPSVPIKKALIAAAARGVSIKIITNSYQTNDIPPIVMLARHNYKEVIDTNYGGDGKDGRPKEIEIWEWTGRKQGSGPLEQGMNHAKFMVVDRKIVFIGSYNIDPRSRNINSEVGLVFEGKAHRLAEELAQEFHNVDLSFSQRVSFRQMISYRKPVRLLRALILKSQGYHFDDSLGQLGKEEFFLQVAHYNEGTW